MSELEEVKQRSREAWGRGNYAVLAELLEPASAALVDACAISAGQEVLDVAAGNGNLALLAAREGAGVVALDLSPAMLELGRARTAAEGYDVEWVEGDVEDLPFDDGRFDCAASVFGAMFAPRPDRVARELFRVVRAGGVVGMASWVPDGLFDRFFEVTSRYNPSPESVPLPTLWGDEGAVRDRLEGRAGRIEMERVKLPFRFESPEAAWGFFDANAPNIVALRDSLGPELYDEVAREILELFRAYATSDGRVDHEAEYLLVVARRPG